MNPTSKKTSEKKRQKKKNPEEIKRNLLRKEKKKEQKKVHKKKEHSKDVDPREDLEDVDYATECDVTLIKPMIFGDLEDQPEAEEKRKREKEKKKKDEKKKKREERKKPDDVINTENSKAKKKDKGKGEKKGDKKNEAKKEDLKGVPIVLIALGQKKGHPLENQIEGPMCLVANRVPGGELKLSRDKKHIFRFVGKTGAGYELIFTRDPIGGKKASILDGTGPIPIGEERLLVFSKECPDVIYYQERSRNCLGGSIRITS